MAFKAFKSGIALFMNGPIREIDTSNNLVSKSIRIVSAKRWIFGFSLLLCTFLGPNGAMAANHVLPHDNPDVGGFTFTIGWIQEPAVVGLLNGLDLRIQNGTTDITGNVAGNMQATIKSGSVTSPEKNLKPQFGRPGWYTFDVIPMTSGIYSVRIFGQLNGTEIDFSADLDEVVAQSDLAFPLDGGATGEISRLNERIANLQVQLLFAFFFGVVGVLGSAGAIVTFLVTVRKAPPK